MVIGNNKISFVVDNVTNLKGDVVLNWTTSSLDAGPSSFFEIIRTAGPQVYDILLGARGHLHEGDAFSTIAGKLHFYLIIHSIVPIGIDYALTWRNIISTLITYKKSHVCRDLYITIPKIEKVQDFINQFVEYQSLMDGMHFVFVGSAYELGETEKALHATKQIKVVKEGVVDKFLKKLTLKIITLMSKKHKLTDGHNKKKLQKSIKRVKRVRLPKS